MILKISPLFWKKGVLTTTGSVVRLVLGQALRPVALGAALGVAAALGASRVLSSQLFGQRAHALARSASTRKASDLGVAASESSSAARMGPTQAGQPARQSQRWESPTGKHEAGLRSPSANRHRRQPKVEPRGPAAAALDGFS